MEAYYVEFSPSAGGFEEAADIPFNARTVVIRHIAGAGVAEYSFDSTTTHGKLIAPASPEGAHPFQVRYESAEGISKVWIKTATETVSIRAWL
jgi:hypothetical protein